MFNVDANVKHVHTHENNTLRLVSVFFVCSSVVSLWCRLRLIPCTSHCGEEEAEEEAHVSSRAQVCPPLHLTVIAMFHAHVE